MAGNYVPVIPQKTSTDWVGQLADDDSDDLEELFGDDDSDDDELLRKERWDIILFSLKLDNTLILYCYYYTLVTAVVGF